MNTQLLLTFTNNKYLDKTINYIDKCYELMDDRIFILSDRDDSSNLFLSYNVVDKDYGEVPYRTMAIHRKRETNTLYTINAVNKIVMKELGYRNSSWEINWKNYRNSLLLTEHWDLVHIHTNLEQIYRFSS